MIMQEKEKETHLECEMHILAQKERLGGVIVRDFCQVFVSFA